MKKDTPNLRFTKVMDALKKQGHTQREIMEKIDLDFINDEAYLSQVKSGHRRKIRDELIDALHREYGVNPAYLKMESDRMFDDMGKRLESFLSVVDDWDVLDGGKNEYLHLTIDKNIVDLLIDLYDDSEAIIKSGVSSLDEQKEKLLQEYSNAKPNPKEYVIIERNNFFKVVSDAIEDRKVLGEVLKLINFDDYPDPSASDKPKD